MVPYGIDPETRLWLIRAEWEREFQRASLRRQAREGRRSRSAGRHDSVTGIVLVLLRQVRSANTYRPDRRRRRARPVVQPDAHDCE